MKTLYDYLTDKARDEGEEVTVWDTDYDLECYFYAPDSRFTPDEWDKAMYIFAKKLTVVEESENGVTVNFTEVISKNINNGKFDSLFIRNTVEAIMRDMHSIVAGYVSEEWLTEFAESLI